MKYKLFCTDTEWLGESGAGIKIWKEDAQGRSLWPCGEPAALPPRAMRGVEDIEQGLSGFVSTGRICAMSMSVESIGDGMSIWLCIGRA